MEDLQSPQYSCGSNRSFAGILVPRVLSVIPSVRLQRMTSNDVLAVSAEDAIHGDPHDAGAWAQPPQDRDGIGLMRINADSWAFRATFGRTWPSIAGGGHLWERSTAGRPGGVRGPKSERGRQQIDWNRSQTAATWTNIGAASTI